MIPNRQQKLTAITSIITGRIAQINGVYRGGPSYHFYQRIRTLRSQHAAVNVFLASGTCVETLYATLVAWDINSRGAKMRDFDDFRNSLLANANEFQTVEALANGFTWANRGAVINALSNLYDHLSLMKTRGKLVSNSKALHFIFPTLCPPMDRTNTLKKLYGHTAENKGKFLEFLEFTYDVLGAIQNPQQYLDNQWNTCETKLVDNAIILM